MTKRVSFEDQIQESKKPKLLRIPIRTDENINIICYEPILNEGIKFRQELIEKQKKREEEQRKRDILQIEEIERRLSQDEEARELLRREAKARKIEEQAQALALLKKKEE